MKLTIDELASEVNKNLSNLKSDDKRFSNNLSPRRIRDYISKGMLDKPFKDGKNIFFTELHLQKLIALREVQSEGISEDNIKKLISYESPIEYKYDDINNTSNTDLLKANALDAINEIINKEEMKYSATASSVNNLTNSISSSSIVSSLLENYNFKKTKDLSYVYKPISKSWNEIPLLNNGKVHFRMESGTTFNEKEKKEILENIKQILGEKND